MAGEKMKLEGNKDKPAEILSFEWPKRRDERGMEKEEKRNRKLAWRTERGSRGEKINSPN